MGVSYNKLALVAAVCMVVMVAPAAEAAISCGQVTKGLIGCLGYLKGGPGPSAGCCGGLKALVAVAKTPADRKTACVCLKQAAGSVTGINFKIAAGLPGKCGVSLPFPISPNTDCSKIH